MGRCQLARCCAMPSHSGESPHMAQFLGRTRTRCFGVVAVVSAATCLPFRGAPLAEPTYGRMQAGGWDRAATAQVPEFVKSDRSRGVDRTHRAAVPACHGRRGWKGAQGKGKGPGRRPGGLFTENV